MVLVPVVAGVGKDNIRLEFSGKIFECVLDRRKLRWKISVSERVQLNCVAGIPSEEFPCCTPCLASPRARRTPYHPAELRSRTTSEQLEHRRTATNLDIIRVSAEA